MAKILVIDDTGIMRNLLSEFLTEEGHDVDTAINGDDGITKALNGDYAIIFCDLHMPKKNGFEVLSEIKVDPDLKHIPVVMLTTSDSEADIVKSYARGACSFITKPMDFDKFRDVIRQFALYWALVSRVPSTAR